MKKRTKIILGTAIFSLILGGSLLTIGLTNNGLTELKKLSAPELTRQTFNSVKEIDSQLYNRDLLIKESPDQKVHLSYYKHDNMPSKLSVKQDNHRLTLAENYTSAIVIGGIQLFGYYLNGQEQNPYQITLEIPKDSQLTNLTAKGYGGVEINQQNIDKVDLQGLINIKQSQIASGTLHGDGIYVQSSQLHNVDISAIDDFVDISKSSLTDSHFSGTNMSLNLTDSNLKNVTGKDIFNSSLYLDKTNLENVTIEAQTTNIDTEQITVKEMVTLSTSNDDIDLDLTVASKDKTNIKLKSINAGIETDNSNTQIKTSQNGTFYDFTKTVTKADATLTVTAENSWIYANY